jgi:hypothetical protein
MTFGWLKEWRLQRAYAREVAAAQHAMNKLADRGLHAEHMAAAEALYDRLKAVRAHKPEASWRSR